MKKNLNLSQDAIMAIKGLQHKAGTFPYYFSTLNRLSKRVLHFGEEMGMTSVQIVETLRALNSLSQDLCSISGMGLKELVNEPSEQDLIEFANEMFDEESDNQETND